MVVVEVLTNNNLLAARALYHKCFFETYSSSTNICYDVLEGKSLDVPVAYRRFHFVTIRGNWKKNQEKPGYQRKSQENKAKQQQKRTLRTSDILGHWRKQQKCQDSGKVKTRPVTFWGIAGQALTTKDNRKIKQGQVTVRTTTSFWIWLLFTMLLGQFEHFLCLFPYSNRCALIGSPFSGVG